MTSQRYTFNNVAKGHKRAIQNVPCDLWVEVGNVDRLGVVEMGRQSHDEEGDNRRSAQLPIGLAGGV